MADGQIVFEVTADGKHAIADIRDITKAIQQEAGKWDTAAKESANNIDNSFSSVLKKLTAGFSAIKVGKALLDIGKQAIQAASDLQEVQNVVDVTFGDNANQIETWSKKAITQFGLTETQAKKFSSTMGALLKSSGIAGDQIVDVSTDLAGLAADMASFYNLDFEDAFSKIRSGISGMTMPLKELGIDMSVATLNAFALQQGMKKTYDQMSQGEQVMLRYQYLMSATADAQGDFARTSDGFANGIRALESEMESLKANVGNNLLPAIQWIVGSINSIFGGSEEEAGKRRTVLDDIADIDAKTAKTVESITATKTQVDELTKGLEDIAGKKDTLETVTSNISGSVEGLNNLATELNGVTFDEGAKSAFEETLAILYNNVDNLSQIKGEDAEGVKNWLDGVAEEAKSLSPEDAAAWTALMSALVGDIPGLENTEEGESLRETLAQQFLALGSDSAEAARGLAALGYNTSEIEERQSAWLNVCRELVRTMPGLADIIDTQTGEIKGGIPAVKEYADEWERMSKYQAEMEGLGAKREAATGLQTEADYKGAVRSAIIDAKAVLKAYGQLTDEQADALIAGAKKAADLAYQGINVSDYGQMNYAALSDAFHAYNFSEQSVGNVEHANDALVRLMQAYYELQEFYDVQPKLIEELDKAERELADEYGITTEEVREQADATQQAAEAMKTLELAANGDADALYTVTEAVDNANAALKELGDYAENVRNSVRGAIDSTTSGFEYLGNAAQRQAKRLEPLEAEYEKLLADGEDLGDIQQRIADASDTYGIGNLTKNLQSQLDFLREYKADMEAARELGFSNEFLAQFADGSVESAEWLHELANASKPQVKELNDLYADVSKGKEELTNTLTEQKLSVDEVYQSLAEKAKEAVAELDLGEEAAENSGKTVSGLAQGIADHVDEVQTAVDSIIEQLERLNGFGINIDLGGFGEINFTTSTGKDADTSGRFGVDYVPFDNYIIRAHEGERLLTAQENQIWNSLLNGGIAGYDLETLGGVMRDNIKPGGNVYLDGKIVGNVISDQQGRSYKSMQRSGWQG